MANITITPTGAAFNPTDTVTSTRLNEARNPTAALVPASVVPSDLSLGAPSWDGLGNTSTGSIFTRNEAIEINAGGTGDRPAYLDFHTAGTNTDFNARIYRNAGLNSDLQILNQGTGTIVVNSTVAQVSNNAQSVTTKAYVDAAILSAVQASRADNYPVGSIYTNATNATNPSTLLGFGTWVTFGAGRVPVGVDSSDTDFDTAEEIGGAKTHQLTKQEIPPHTHSYNMKANITGGTIQGGDPYNLGVTSYQTGSGNIGENSDGTGSASPHNNLQPYIVVYMWKRTA